MVGYGFDRGTLVEAGIEQAFALAAVTSGDNSNIVTARVARENFGIERVVARIYDPRRAAIFQKLGIPTVATVSWTTDQVLRRLLPSEHHSEWLDPTGAVALIELAVPPGLAGMKLAALNSPGKWWLTSVTRLGTARVTTDTLVLQEGDIAHFVVEVAAIPELRDRVAAGKRRTNEPTIEARMRVVIAGGGNVGSFIARELHGLGPRRWRCSSSRPGSWPAAGPRRATTASTGWWPTPASSARWRPPSWPPATWSSPPPATTRTTWWCRCWPARSSPCPASWPGSTTPRTSGCSTRTGASTSPCRPRTCSPR